VSELYKAAFSQHALAPDDRAVHPIHQGPTAMAPNPEAIHGRVSTEVEAATRTMLRRAVSYI